MAASENPRVSAAKLALAVRRLRTDKESLDLLGSDPIAVIGMGCRFPGGPSPEEFWKSLKAARDCVGEIPAGRWMDADSLPHTLRKGGYLADIEGFDAGFFGIAPREAQHVDPQQRLLLEVVWEALWNAGIEPASLAGTDTGVFAAIYNSDYARLEFRDTTALTPYTGIGASHSVAAGRLSFLLNIKGPSVAIDSACSSSLVATHLACQSLRARECDLAIVAASSLKILSDEVRVFSKWGMLASDGRCKTFDAAADGFAPGEGAGAVLLKRLSDALQDGDRVRAVIRGTAVNHDGRTTVLTAPNSLAQEAVLRAALRNAMLDAHEVDYVETHGTGTSLGDPIEIEAVRSVYGISNADAPCVLGAVKSNVGHLEAAAGLAGFIKVVLCLENEEIPKNLHFRSLNPEISLSGSRLAIATENVSWVRGTRPRVAAVSSFGLGGTNGHIVVEESPLLPERSNKRGRPIPLAARMWQRQRFPIAEPVAAKQGAQVANFPGGVLHPLLGNALQSPFVAGNLFTSEISAITTPYLAEHGLSDRGLMPFAAFLEIAAAAIRHAHSSRSICIQNFAMHEPRFVSSDICKLQTLVANNSVEIASEDGSAWKTNAKGDVGSVAAQNERIDFDRIRHRCSRAIDPESIYELLERTGLRYGSAFRTLQSVRGGDGEAFAHVKISDALRNDASAYGLHPTVLDGCLQSLMAARQDCGDALFLPIHVDSFELLQTGLTEVWVHTKIVASSEQSFSADIAIADEQGAVVAKLTGFTAKRAVAGLLAAHHASRLSYEIHWQKSPLSTVNTKHPSEKSNWLVVDETGADCGRIVKVLETKGISCTFMRGEEFTTRLNEREWAGILYDGRPAPQSAQELPRGITEKAAVDFILSFAAWLKQAKSVPQLRVLTSSAMPVVQGEDVLVEQAPLWGLVRTLALEHPETAPVIIDVAHLPCATSEIRSEADSMLLAAILSDGSEPMVAFRNGERYVARLTREIASEPQHLRLHAAPSGRLEDLQTETGTRRAPEKDEIEIQVRTAGLNFRDVLTAMGMLPARAASLGAECSGAITRIGSGVSGFNIGDNVLAFAPCALQSFVTVPAAFAVRKSGDISFEAAATIPVAFLTAQYGLKRLAKLVRGQRILIHAAAGGLGLAAVQLAQSIGAEIFATAGNPEKRAFLRGLGIRHVFDSRTLAFRDEVLAATGGSGVDVVLNLLAGDFIGASFETLGRSGCFLEVGKRGIWPHERVAALGKEIRYFPYDLGDVAMENPAMIAEMLGELARAFESGELRPLPAALYPIKDASDAFRTMAQARHIGKIVLNLQPNAPQIKVQDLVSRGTVLVTGGLGALGVEVARWLAIRGAKHIVLAGRNATDNGTHAIVDELRRQGIEVGVERVDVADSAQVEALLKKIRAAWPPLRAVFHTAGIVQDSILATESWSNYREVTAAKIDGAWNLDRLTQNDPVECMVFFSSAASVLGSQGQGSYAAGNAFLDALAHRRAARGLRTFSVNWGAWASGGMAARLTPAQAERWARQGVTPMQASDALAALETAIEAGHSQIAVLDADWKKFCSAETSGRNTAFFAELLPRQIAPHHGVISGTRQEGIAEKIASVAIVERGPILAAHIKTCARKALGLEDSVAIADNIPLQEIGLDSLMALEMRNDLAQSLRLSLAAGLLFDYPSVDALTSHLLELLPVSSRGTSTRRGDEPTASTTDGDLESLSEEEAERLLSQELERFSAEKTNA